VTPVVQMNIKIPATLKAQLDQVVEKQNEGHPYWRQHTLSKLVIEILSDRCAQLLAPATKPKVRPVVRGPQQKLPLGKKVRK